MATATSPCELILALDVPDRATALPLLQDLQKDLRWVKIGLQLFLREGHYFVDEVAAMGFRVFLDLKLHDIPNTVAGAIRSLQHCPANLLTLHALGGPAMLRAAAEAAAEALPDTTLLAVTVLTSMNEAELAAIGVEPNDPAIQVPRLAQMAVEQGIGGIVCSPREVVLLRGSLGPEPLLVTPGIRPAHAASDDQKRVLTPAEAKAHGASGIVVGRPILRASDPVAATRQILAELG